MFPWRKHARHLDVVSGHYETHWSQIPWPKTNNADPGEKTIVSFWDDEGMLIRGYGRKRAHHLLFARVVRELRPRRALEVGCGNGFNLLIMATLFPEIEWHGVELTEAGVQVGSSIQKEAELPQALQEFLVDPIVDRTAHRKVKLRQGDASKLPFKDEEFDLVFSFLALEQMQSVRDKALSEIARVTARNTINIEPFRDYNQLPIQKHYREARGYLDLHVNELTSFGLKPIFTFDGWPQKLTLAAGAVVTEK
jgi:SAM-dependent methyltransferase